MKSKFTYFVVLIGLLLFISTSSVFAFSPKSDSITKNTTQKSGNDHSWNIQGDHGVRGNLPPETEVLGIIPSASDWYSGLNNDPQTAADEYHDDTWWGPLPIGFSFEFYGNVYTQFYVTSNGMITFGTGIEDLTPNQETNRHIPSTGPNNGSRDKIDNFIAPFWDDIELKDEGDIMYATIGASGTQKTIVQFTNMGFWNDPVLLGTFQIILYEGSNDVQFQYRSIVDPLSNRSSGGSASIGVENIDGTIGVECSYNTPGAVESGKAIHYTYDSVNDTLGACDGNAVYEGILLVGVNPRAGITQLVIPANGSTVNPNVNFLWETPSNAHHYKVLISQQSDMSPLVHTSVDLTDTTYFQALTNNRDYYWQVYSYNAVGDVTWSEIWQFHTSNVPPLVAVPQTMFVELGAQANAALLSTGGDGSPLIATITSLPVSGYLLQSDGVTPIAVGDDVTDAAFNVIYVADGDIGNDQGSFNFRFRDSNNVSSIATYTVNVNDVTSPTITCSANQSQNVDAASCDALVSVVAPTVMDIGGAYQGYSLSFDGINDYVEVSSFPNTNPMPSFSIEAWIYTNDNAKMGQRVFCDDENNTNGYALSIGDGGAGSIRFYSRGMTNIILDANAVISNNTWHHVVAVADIANSMRYIYVDGVEVASMADPGTWGTDIGPASIGGETDLGETANRFFGKIRDVGVWTKALSPAEILAHSDFCTELNGSETDL